MATASRMTGGQGAQRINPWRQFHGVFLPLWLLERPEVSMQGKVLYAILASIAGRRGVCWPSQHWLGKRLGVKERQLRNYLAELVTLRLIEIKQRGRRAGGLGQTAYFWFLRHRWIVDSVKYARQPIAGHNSLPGNRSAGQKPPPSKGSRAPGLDGSLKTSRPTAETPAAKARVNGRSQRDRETPKTETETDTGPDPRLLAQGLARSKRMPAMRGLPDGR